MEVFATILGTVLAAVIAAGGTWFVTARKLSGTVKTSTAEDLWKESADIRKWIMDRNAHLEDENLELRKELTRCHDRMTKMENTLKELLGEGMPDYLS